jgi:hypothetical protein
VLRRLAWGLIGTLVHPSEERNILPLSRDSLAAQHSLPARATYTIADEDTFVFSREIRINAIARHTDDCFILKCHTSNTFNSLKQSNGF